MKRGRRINADFFRLLQINSYAEMNFLALAICNKKKQIVSLPLALFSSNRGKIRLISFTNHCECDIVNR